MTGPQTETTPTTDEPHGQAGPMPPFDLDLVNAQVEHGRRRMRRQILIGVIVGVLSVAATIGSILGQGIAYRQMRALEDIAGRCSR